MDQQFNMKFSNTMDQNSGISSETEQNVAPKLLSDEYIKKLPQRKKQKNQIPRLIEKAHLLEL